MKSWSTYVRHPLRALVVTATTLMLSTVALAAPASASGCNQGVCASIWLVSSTTTSVHVILTTTTPTQVWLFAFDPANKPQDVPSHQGLATVHDMTVTGLRPHTDYTWFADIADASNHSLTQSGPVSTAAGHVQVRFDSVSVAYDSDDFGAGEITSFGLAGTTRIDLEPERSISSGDTVTLGGAVVTLADTSSTVRASVELEDDDCNWGALCLEGTGPDWGNGSTPERDWATATAWLPTSNQAAGWHSVNASVVGPLWFTQHVSYQVIP